MPESIRKIDLSELRQVRIVCTYEKERGQPCGTIIEVPIEKLKSLKSCPVCEVKLLPIIDVTADPFLILPKVFASIIATPNLKFSFVLTEDKE